jgi:hypothetical protein
VLSAKALTTAVTRFEPSAWLGFAVHLHGRVRKRAALNREHAALNRACDRSALTGDNHGYPVRTELVVVRRSPAFTDGRQC